VYVACVRVRLPSFQRDVAALRPRASLAFPSLTVVADAMNRVSQCQRLRAAAAACCGADVLLVSRYRHNSTLPSSPTQPIICPFCTALRLASPHPRASGCCDPGESSWLAVASTRALAPHWTVTDFLPPCNYVTTTASRLRVDADHEPSASFAAVVSNLFSPLLAVPRCCYICRVMLMHKIPQ
jgi:hypothetical protein